MTAIERQDAFAQLLESLRSTEPTSKPAAFVGPEDSYLEEREAEPLECQDCGGTGGDGGALDGWEPCGHCHGSGVEPVSTTVQQVGRAA